MPVASVNRQHAPSRNGSEPEARTNAARASEKESREHGSVYTGGCNATTITLIVWQAEPTRTTKGDNTVRTVRCLRREGLNATNTVWVDVWFWRSLGRASECIKVGDEITVTCKITGLRPWTNEDGLPAATITLTASNFVRNVPRSSRSAPSARQR